LRAEDASTHRFHVAEDAVVRSGIKPRRRGPRNRAAKFPLLGKSDLASLKAVGKPPQPIPQGAPRPKRSRRRASMPPLRASQLQVSLPDGPSLFQSVHSETVFDPIAANVLQAPLAAATLGDIGAQTVISTVSTNNPISDTIFNGVPPPGADPRWPDPYTMIRTGVWSNTMVHTGLNSIATSSLSSTATYDHCCYGLFKGSPTATLLYATSMGTSTTSVVQPMNWDATTGTPMTIMNAGINSSGYYTRPCGVAVKIRPVLRGVAHDCQVYAFPLLPFRLSTTAAAPAGWPTNPLNGLTATAAAWGGRAWGFKATDGPVQLCALPMDSRALDFLSGNVERAAIDEAYGQAWSGWAWWVTGLSSIDTVELTISITEEFALTTLASAGLLGYPMSIRKTHAAQRDLTTDTVQRVTQRGGSGVRVTDVIDFARKAWNVGRTIWDAVGSTAAAFGMPTASFTPMMQVEREEEEKAVVLAPAPAKLRLGGK